MRVNTQMGLKDDNVQATKCDTRKNMYIYTYTYATHVTMVHNHAYAGV